MSRTKIAMYQGLRLQWRSLSTVLQSTGTMCVKSIITASSRGGSSVSERQHERRSTQTRINDVHTKYVTQQAIVLHKIYTCSH